ncbi:MAG TPA: hypothetical protein VN862_07460 [Candidatus Acidoferrales bacterium]|nr:hypothetical protein [Candidatus Acidoferrales bacterium]
MFIGVFRKIAKIASGPASVLTALLLTAGLLCFQAGAQQAGPIKPPPSSAPPAPATPPGVQNSGSQQAPQLRTKTSDAMPATPSEHGNSSPITTTPPAIPAEQIIPKFAAREAEFKKERDNYTYTQNFLIETLDESDQPDGEYRLTSEIVFTPEGRRYEHVTFAPPTTLERILLTPEDMQDLQNIQPFVLTTEELPKYDIKYVGQQRVDEIDAYIFDVGPKKIEKGQRYFQGRVWVDQKDLEIVKTYGKAVPDLKDNVFPMFETFRENIEGDYWFPTYTRADDVLHFPKAPPVHIRMSVRYSNYKRFGVTIKIKAASQDH